MASLFTVVAVVLVLFILPAGLIHGAAKLDPQRKVAQWADRHLW